MIRSDLYNHALIYVLYATLFSTPRDPTLHFINALYTVNEIGEKYNLNPYTISLINVGKLWRKDELCYPIRSKTLIQIKRKNHKENHKEKYYCKKCGKELHDICKTNMCFQCYCGEKYDYIPDSNTLYNLLLHNSFEKVSDMYGVSSAAIRKWCDKYNIPRHSSYYRKQREMSA